MERLLEDGRVHVRLIDDLTEPYFFLDNAGNCYSYLQNYVGDPGQRAVVGNLFTQDFRRIQERIKNTFLDAIGKRGKTARELILGEDT